MVFSRELAKGFGAGAMNPALVTILIPCYNAEGYLDAALESAFRQTWPAVEIILINDGSSDNSLKIAHPYVARGLTVIDQPNRGASAARNAGLKVARGDFIQYLDADDLLAPDKIELQMNALALAPAGSLATASWGSFENDPTRAHFNPEPIWADFDPINWLTCSWGGGGMMHPAAWLTPRRVAEEAGPWDESLSLDDDGEYFCRIILRSTGVRFVHSARSYYRSHAGSRLSASSGEIAARSSFTSCLSKEKQLLGAENSDRTRRACAQNYARFAWEQLAAAPELASAAEARWRQLDPHTRIPPASRFHEFAVRLFGWRATRRLQLWRSRSR